MNSILTRPSGFPRWQSQEFSETGRAEIDVLLADLGSLAPTLSRRRALDFGCGLGRLTSALAGYFDEVVGIDIAETMVADARRLHANLKNCRFHLNLRSDLAQFPDNHFDFVLAWIVLQHMPPALMERYIADCIRLLAPGGVLVFQVPAEAENPEKDFCDAPVVGGRFKQIVPRLLIRLSRRLRYQIYRRFVPHMEMYGMSRQMVVDLVLRRGDVSLMCGPTRAMGWRHQDSRIGLPPSIRPCAISHFGVGYHPECRRFRMLATPPSFAHEGLLRPVHRALAQPPPQGSRPH